MDIYQKVLNIINNLFSNNNAVSEAEMNNLLSMLTLTYAKKVHQDKNNNEKTR